VRFDYLHSARPLLLLRLLECRVPERFHSALFALAGAVAVIGGAWAIESYRLAQALQMQALYQARYDGSERRLKAANVYYDRVRRLLDLDRRVRTIAVSGDTDARTLAEIANELPEHAWLTGISRDESGLALQGRARDLAAVSAVLRGLMRAKHLQNPTLESAALEQDPAYGNPMKYEIHVNGVAR
jgi:hypothetical protein